MVKTMLSEQIVRSGIHLTSLPQSTYIVAYPALLSHFARVERFQRHDVIVGATIVYGWMPTILRLKSDEGDDVADLLNRVRRGAELTCDELTIIKTFVNGSVVGTSKLLHFVAPDRYPIWDRRVARWLFRRSHQAFVNRVRSYVEYREVCQAAAGDRRFPKVHAHVNRLLSYEVSSMRAAELVAFNASGP